MATIMNMLPDWFTKPLESRPDNRLIAGGREYESVVDPEYHLALEDERNEKQNSPSIYYAKKLRNIIYGGGRGVLQNVGASLYGANEFMKAPIGEYFEEGGFGRVRNRATEKMMDRSYLHPSHEGAAALSALSLPFEIYEGLARATADVVKPYSPHAAAGIYGAMTTVPVETGVIGKALAGGALRSYARGKGYKVDPLGEVGDMLDSWSILRPLARVGENVPIALWETPWSTTGPGTRAAMAKVRGVKELPESERIGFYSGGAMRVFSLAKGFVKGVGRSIRTHLDPDAAFKMKESGLSHGATKEITDALVYANAMAKKYGPNDGRVMEAMNTVYSQFEYAHIFNLKTGRSKVGDMDDMSRMFEVFYPNLVETRGVITPADVIELTGTDVKGKFLAPLLESAYGDVGFKINPFDRVIYGAANFRKKTGVVQNELSSTSAHKTVADFLDRKIGSTADELRNYVNQLMDSNYTSKNKDVPKGRFPSRIRSVNVDGKDYIHYVITKPSSNQLLGGIRADYLLDSLTGRAIELISDETDLLGGVLKNLMNLASNNRFATVHIRERMISRKAGATAQFDRDLNRALKRIDEIDNVDIAALSMQADKLLSNQRVSGLAKERRLDSLNEQRNKLLAEKQGIEGLYPFAKYSRQSGELDTMTNYANKVHQWQRDVAEWKKLKASGEIRKNAAKPKKPSPPRKVVESGKWDQKMMDDLTQKLLENPGAPLSYIFKRMFRTTLGAQVQGYGIRKEARNELEL